MSPEPPVNNIFLSPFSDSSTSWWTQAAVILQWGLPPTLSCIATTRGSCESWGELEGICPKATGPRRVIEKERAAERKTLVLRPFLPAGEGYGEGSDSNQDRRVGWGGSKEMYHGKG